MNNEELLVKTAILQLPQQTQMAPKKSKGIKIVDPNSNKEIDLATVSIFVSDNAFLVCRVDRKMFTFYLA